MRFHLTPAFQAARDAWQNAYAVMDRIHSREDKFAADHSPESIAAGDMEEATINLLLIMPASTPTEIGEKLRIMRERGIDHSWATDYPRFMAQIERDLIELQRPAVSPPIAEAFHAWAMARADYETGTDEQANRYSDAFIGLMRHACYAPGDMIVKVYANMIGSHGSTVNAGDGRSLFEIDPELPGGLDGIHDIAADRAALSDLGNCDLGRCLTMLGRVNFDAAAWLEAAKRTGVGVRVLEARQGNRSLWLDEPTEALTAHQYERLTAIHALIGGGLGVIGEMRRREVIEQIAAEVHTLQVNEASLMETAA